MITAPLDGLLEISPYYDKIARAVFDSGGSSTCRAEVRARSKNLRKPLPDRKNPPTRPARLKTASDFEVRARARAQTGSMCARARASARAQPHGGRWRSARRRGAARDVAGGTHLSEVHARAFTYA